VVAHVRVRKRRFSVACIIVDDTKAWLGDILLGIDMQRELGIVLDFGADLVKGFGTDIRINYPDTSRNTAHKIRIKYDVDVEPHQCKIVACKSVNEAVMQLLEPHPDYHFVITPGVLTCREPSVIVTNTSNRRISFKRNQVIGRSTSVASVVLATPDRADSASTEEEYHADLENLIDCPEQFKHKLLAVLAPYRPSVLARKGEPLGRTHLTKMDIKLKPGSNPIALTPYRIPHSQLPELNRQLDELLRLKVISPTTSPWSAPLVLVRKSDGSMRICCDYRKLNAQTIGSEFPLPNISELIAKLSQAQYFSSIDMLSAYFQVPLTESAKEMTAFRTPDRHFQFNVSPFGLKNMPAVFQRLVNNLFASEIQTKPDEIPILAYLDDILIASKDVESHLKRIKYVFDRLHYANLKVRMDKCCFFQRRVNFLGHVVSAGGYSPQEDKIKAIKHFPRPTNVKAIRAFLGLAGYYRVFIPGFSTIAEPLSRLTKVDVPFVWTTAQENAFDTLKTVLTGETILRYPDFNKEFFVETDASNIGIGCVVTQQVDGKRVPIAYSSRLLRGSERNYSVTEKEGLAVVEGLRKHRYILYGYKITVITDHQPLVSLFRNTLACGRLGRWALLVQDFDVHIVYRPGRLNNVPDVLSRYPAEDDAPSHVSAAAVNVVRRGQPQLKEISPEELREAQRADGEYGPIISRLVEKPEFTPEGVYHLRNGILHAEVPTNDPRLIRNKVKVVIPQILVVRVLQLNHDSKFCGHAGIDRTIRRIQTNFWIKGLREIVTKYVATCPMCLSTKRKYTKDCEIRMFPVPSRCFEQVHLDLVGPLPRSERGRKYIMVVTDRLSRYTIAESITDKSAETVVEALHRRIIVEYSTPSVLLSDNAKEFVSELMSEMCRYYGVRKVHCASYHPASNGLVERANAKVVAALRTSVSQNQTDWDTLVPYAQVAINCAYHHSIGDVPHYLVYLQDKVLPYDLLIREASQAVTPGSRSEYIEEAMLKAKIALECARNSLAEEQAKFTRRVNVGRSPSEIKPGMRVYIRKHVVKAGLTRKLQPKYKGPYRILEALAYNKYRVRDLTTAAEEVVHHDHMKIVPEYCIERETNHTVRSPYPHLLTAPVEEDVTTPPREYVTVRRQITSMPNRESNDSVTELPTQTRSPTEVTNLDVSNTRTNNSSRHAGDQGFVPNYERPHTRSRGPPPPR